MSSILFVTGTDTGVGKTVVTGLLLRHLQEEGVKVRGIKPFCSGTTDDVRFLQELQGGKVQAGKINPFFFPKALAPGVQPWRGGRRPGLQETLEFIEESGSQCEVLLVEGCGGVMVPLGPGFMLLDLVRALQCRVVLVAANRLGAINHTLLTLESLKSAGIQEVAVILSETERGNRMVKRSNAEFLKNAVDAKPLISLGFLGENGISVAVMKKTCKKMKKHLARVVGSG